jgi:hypothetical protein
MPETGLTTLEAPTKERPDAISFANPIRTCRLRERFWKWFVALNVVGLLIAAVDLRCAGLGNLPGINGDEAWYGVQAELFLHGERIPWRTPSGNLLNPLFFMPQVVLHAFVQPSFALLRLTAVVSGLITLAVNFWLCRRAFGRGIAIISTVILAVLPIDIAYSRLAWDASQSLLVTLPCVYLPLWAVVDSSKRFRLSIATFAAICLAVIVHPTNIFIAPIAVVSLGYAWRTKLLPPVRRVVEWRPRLPNIRVISGAIVLAAALAAWASHAAHAEWLPKQLARLADPHEFSAFLANFGRLFSGATVYEYLAGSVGPAPTSGAIRVSAGYLIYDIAGWIVAAWLGWALTRNWKQRRPELACLLIGWALALFGFFLVAGASAIAPNFERYAIWIIGPTTVLASIAIHTMQQRASWRHAPTVVALALAWVLVFNFQTNCLGFLRTTGGQSHRTFRTAVVEPKQSALEVITAEWKPGEKVVVRTSQWWLYWPMRYLSFANQFNPSGALSVDKLPVPNRFDPSSFARSTPGERFFFVEFAGSPECEALREQARRANIALQEQQIVDFAGRPVVSVFAVRPIVGNSMITEDSSANNQISHSLEKN